MADNEQQESNGRISSQSTSSVASRLKRVGSLLPRPSYRVNDDRYDHFRRQKLQEYPRGYPQLAAYTNSDDNCHLCRRFGYVRSRLILYTQDEVQQLEKKLTELDTSDAANDQTEYRLNSRQWDEEHSTARKDVIAKLKIKLKEYDDLVFRERQMLRINAPSRKDFIHYFNYIWNEKPLCPDEYAFIFQEDDMLDLVAEQENEFWSGMIDLIIATVPRKILRFLFSDAADRDKDHSKESDCFSTERLVRTIKGLLLLVSLILLIVPVALLYILDNLAPGAQLGIVIGFMALFAAALLFGTRARRHEVFVSAATYCAVLVVFLSNVSKSPATG